MLPRVVYSVDTYIRHVHVPRTFVVLLELFIKLYYCSYIISNEKAIAIIVHFQVPVEVGECCWQMFFQEPFNLLLLRK